jgi:hypothetical protein
MATTVTSLDAGRPSSRRAAAALILVALIGTVFVAGNALPYFRLTQEQFGMYWPRRWWLMLHIVTGAVALLSGPLQLWLGITDRNVALHRRLGVIYTGSVVVSSVAAYYLALHTDGGWVFGAGLAGLATAWLTTTGLAIVAIRRHLYEQHKEWMVRSYVVTTGFLTFRLLLVVLTQAGVGTLTERLGAAAWFCWALPLVITEAVLQGRKIIGVRPL